MKHTVPDYMLEDTLADERDAVDLEREAAVNEILADGDLSSVYDGLAADDQGELLALIKAYRSGEDIVEAANALAVKAIAALEEVAELGL